MRITQRQIGLGIQIVIASITALLALYYFVIGAQLYVTLSVAISALVGTILLVSYIRNWRYAIPALLIVTIFVVGFSPPKPLFTLDKSLMLFVAPILALLLSRTRWVVFSIVLPFIIFAGRTGLENLPALPSFYTLFTMIAAGFILARLSIDTALDAANANAEQANQARIRSEEQAQELVGLNTQMRDQLTEQQRLLQLVATLETPVSNMADGVLFVPLVGSLDTRRLQAITQRILQATSQQRSRLVILDIAGVAGFDKSSAQGLLSIAQALRLLGSQVTISGISAELATTLTDLDVHIRQFETVRSPQEALERYQRKQLTS